MSVERVLNDEILNELENLSRETIGSEEYKANVDGVTKLIDRKIAMDKLASEKIDKETEFIYKECQIKEEKKDRLIKHGITIGTFVGSATLYSLAFLASINFEREGTLTTEGGRNALRNLFKLKWYEPK